eukprot:SAG31_NODE_893_length_11177_cov_10.241806_15_plen_68_part_00
MSTHSQNLWIILVRTSGSESAESNFFLNTSASPLLLIRYSTSYQPATGAPNHQPRSAYGGLQVRVSE